MAYGKLPILILLLFTSLICKGQNLVPNPSFEQMDTCPNALSQIYHAIPWNDPTPPTGSDFHHICGSSLAGVPSNYYGYEYAHSGNGYAGVMTYEGLIPFPYCTREYIQVQLTDTLKPGVNYFVRFYVSAGDSCNFISHSIGAYFSDVSILDTTSFPQYLQLTPQFENDSSNLLNSRVGWTEVSGNFVADGGEKYMLIGNFRHDSVSWNAQASWPWTFQRNWAYYYIDDVCLATDSFSCNLSTGFNEVKNETDLIMFPNPFNNELNISAQGINGIEITMYDITARKILNQSFSNATSINTAYLAKGLYFYEIRSKAKAIKKGKIVKEE